MATLREEIKEIVSDELNWLVSERVFYKRAEEIEIERDAAEKTGFLFLGGFVFSLAHLLISGLLGEWLFLHWGFVFVALAGMVMNKIQVS